jgi:hypothetical protein
MRLSKAPENFWAKILHHPRWISTQSSQAVHLTKHVI